MARFYGSISGQAKTKATRQGSEKSGIWGHIRGWNIGVSVFGYVDEAGRDCFKVYRTSGSAGFKSDVLICHMTEDE